MLIHCFKCKKDIDSDHQIYYVFIGKTNIGNEEYCTDCYLQDVKEAKALDPSLNKSLSDIYSKNFIRMNK